MWRMLQQQKPDDFVLATGETHSVKEFIDAVFSELEMDLDWKGENENEAGMFKKDGRVCVEVDPRYYRPTEVELLIGNPAKAKEKLGWIPKTTFKDLAKMMARADFEKVKKRGY
jgi:GDPmannose 4,6-dehydratase